MKYVVLKHETPPGYPRPLHWDLMLEEEQMLKTWALCREPTLDIWIAAEPLADHRKTYLDYEGPISRGRGIVTQVDAGRYRQQEQSGNITTINLSGGKLGPTLLIERNPAGKDRVMFRGS